MKSSEKNLLLKIARNPEPQDVFDKLKKGKDVESPYTEVVKAQVEMGVKDMHLPEPWNGHLSKANVMVISSNPSISADENFPTKKWNDDDIAEFFDGRFSEERENISRFWSSIAKYVSWILPEAEGKSVMDILDEFVVMTEIVHCKSKEEIGVNECASEEVKFLDEIISKFTGDYIIILGSTAGKFYQNALFQIKNNNAKVAVLPHPNAHGITDEERKKTLLKQME